MEKKSSGKQIKTPTGEDGCERMGESFPVTSELHRANFCCRLIFTTLPDCDLVGGRDAHGGGDCCSGEGKKEFGEMLSWEELLFLAHFTNNATPDEDALSVVAKCSSLFFKTADNGRNRRALASKRQSDVQHKKNLTIEEVLRKTMPFYWSCCKNLCQLYKQEIIHLKSWKLPDICQVLLRNATLKYPLEKSRCMFM